MSTAKTSPYLHPLPSPSLGPSRSRTSFPWKQIRLVAPSPPATNVPDLLDYDCPYQWVRGRFQPQLKLLGSNETESQWLADASDSRATQRGYPNCFASALGRGRDERTALVRFVHLQKFRARYVKSTVKTCNSLYCIVIYLAQVRRILTVVHCNLLELRAWTLKVWWP